MIWRIVIGSSCIVVVWTCVGIMLALPSTTVFAVGIERLIYLAVIAALVIIALGALFVLKCIFD